MWQEVTKGVYVDTETGAIRGLGAFLEQSGAAQRVEQGFARRTSLTPDQEAQFQAAVAHLSALYGRRINPDDKTYDLRGAWLSGNLTPTPSQHMPSEFKGLGDERLFLPLGSHAESLPVAQGGRVEDTRTLQPNPSLMPLWRIISGIMNRP